MNSAAIIQNVFDTLESELGILPVMSGRELADTTRKPDKLTMMSYLSQIYEMFRREIPAAIGMGNTDPFSVTVIHGSKRFSDDEVLDKNNDYDSARQKYQRRGKHTTVYVKIKTNNTFLFLVNVVSSPENLHFYFLL